jgi:hypothetical protein
VGGGAHGRLGSSGGGTTTEIGFELEYLGEFRFLFEIALGYNPGVRGRVLMKKPLAKNHVWESFKIKR